MFSIVRRFFLKFTIALLTAMMLYSGPALGESLQEREAAILELINQVRKKPFDQLVDLGIDVQSLVDASPWMGSFLSKSMPELKSDPRLARASIDLARQRVTGQDLSDSDDIQALLRKGYDYQAYGQQEVWNMLVFDNYMPARKAVTELVRVLFKEELDCGRENGFVLLNPNSRDVGLSLMEGPLDKDLDKVNGYSLHVLTATGKDYMVEGHLELMINSFRQNPFSYISLIGADSEIELPDKIKDTLSMRLQPLAVDYSLKSASQVIAAHIVDSNNLSINQDEIRYVLAAFSSNMGFDPEYIDYVVAMTRLADHLDPAGAAEQIFTDLMMQGNSAYDNFELLLKPRFGLSGFAVLPIENHDGYTDIVSVGILARSESMNMHVMGRVLPPADGSWHHNPLGVYFRMSPPFNDNYVPLDPLGRYQVNLPRIDLPVAAMNLILEGRGGHNLQTRNIFLNGSNIMVDF